MKESYIKLFRSFKNWGWYSDVNTKAVFLELLLRARVFPEEYRGCKLSPGDAVFGRKELSKLLGISEQSVRTALEHLISTNEITIKSTNKFTVVTIVNWKKWQVCEGESNQQSNQHTNQQSTNNQPTINHIKESKNNKNVKNDYSYKDAFDIAHENYLKQLKNNNKKDKAKAVTAKLKEINNYDHLGGMTTLEFMNSPKPANEIKSLKTEFDHDFNKGAREAAAEYEEWLREQGRIK